MLSLIVAALFDPVAESLVKRFAVRAVSLSTAVGDESSSAPGAGSFIRPGHIFFPKQWVAATLRGHNTPEADAIVEQFLKDHPDYPELLKNKVLQAAAHGQRYDVSTD